MGEKVSEVCPVWSVSAYCTFFWRTRCRYYPKCPSGFHNRRYVHNVNLLTGIVENCTEVESREYFNLLVNGSVTDRT